MASCCFSECFCLYSINYLRIMLHITRVTVNMIYIARAEELKKDIFVVDGKMIAFEVVTASAPEVHFLDEFLYILRLCWVD